MKNILLLAFALSLLSVVSCAYELGFYLTFEGASSSNVTGVNKAKAQSQQTTTLIDNYYGVTYNERRYIGASAVWLSDFDNNKLSESGNITFGINAPNSPVHIINFQLLNTNKYIAQWHGYEHGAGYYNVTGGQGAFQGADGILAFTCTRNTSSDLTYFQHVTGSIWLQGNPPPPPSPVDA